MLTTLFVSHDGCRKQRFWLRLGQSATVGSSEEACFPIEGDPSLERVHFALDCHADGCRIKDLSSAGTQLNGQKISEGDLQCGDTIVAGGTVIDVTIEGRRREPSRQSAEAATLAAIHSEPPDQQPSGDHWRYSIGCWHFSNAPDGWDFEPGKGFTRRRPGEMPEFLQVSEHGLPPGTTLATLKGQMAAESPKQFERFSLAPIEIPGADEGLELASCLRRQDSSVLQRQLFVRRQQTLGIAMLVSLADDSDQAQQTFQTFIQAMSFCQLPEQASAQMLTLQLEPA